MAMSLSSEMKKNLKVDAGQKTFLLALICNQCTKLTGLNIILVGVMVWKLSPGFRKEVLPTSNLSGTRRLVG